MQIEQETKHLLVGLRTILEICHLVRYSISLCIVDYYNNIAKVDRDSSLYSSFFEYTNMQDFIKRHQERNIVFLVICRSINTVGRGVGTNSVHMSGAKRLKKFCRALHFLKCILKLRGTPHCSGGHAFAVNA